MPCLMGCILFLLFVSHPHRTIGQGASCSPTVLGHSDTTEELTVSRGERFGFYAYYSSCLNEVWSSETSSNLSTSPSYNITEEIFFEHYITSKLSSIAQLSSSGQYYFTVSNNIGQSYTLTFQLRVEMTPELTIIPRKLNAAQGDNASLICEAVGSPLPSVISWYYNSILISSSPQSIKNEEKHTVTSTLLFQPLRREDEGYYYCSSYNYISQGRRAGNSPQVFTNVYFPAQFVLKPVSVTRGVAGGNVSLYCSVMANPLPPVVSWLIGNGINVTNSSTSDLVIPKIINSTLVLENLKLTDEQNYTCYVEQVIPSNNNRTIIETQTQLLIAYPPQLSSPIVNVTVNISDEITLSCQGFGNPRPVIEWYFTSQDGAEFQLYDASTSLPLNDTTIASYLTLTNLTLDQEGSYKCKGKNNVTNLIGTTEEISIYLNIQVPPVVIRSNSSSNYTLLVNGSITLSFNISSASPLVRNELISWTLTTVNGGIKALKSSGRFNFSVDGLSMTIYPLSLEDNGLIQMSATNEAGTSKGSYYLLIGTVPEVVSSTRRQVEIAIGTRNVSFTCSSFGYPTPVLTWYINDHDLIISRDKYSLLDLNNGTSVLTVFDISLSDAAQYTCLTGNVFGNDTVDNYLSVQVPPNVTLTPSQVTLSVSDSLQLVCSSYGLPVVSLVWYFGASRDPLESNESILNISQSITMHGPLLMTTSVLSIDSVTGRWEGMFTCEGFNNVTNLIRTPENDTTEVIIPIPPKVHVIGSNNVTAVLSQSLIIAVSLSESSPPVRLADIMWSFTNTSGYTNSITNSSSENYQFSSDYLILTISDISFSDEGNYEVTVFTTAGNDSALIAVDVEMQPLPTTSFLRVEVLIGHNASLPCEAASEPVHSIEWRVNDINVVTDNGTKYVNGMKYGELIITNTAPSDAGEYTCTISNIHGEANITVILDILVPPVLEYSSKSEVLFVGHSYDISVKIINKPNPPVNSSSIMLHSSRFLEAVIMYNESLRSVNIFFNNVTVNHSGTYQLTVENRAGKDNVNITLDVEALPHIYTASHSTIILNEGDSTSLDCVADGLPSPSLSWFANGEKVFADTNFVIEGPDMIESIRVGVPAISSKLNGTNLLPTHNGSYTCMVENKWGRVGLQYSITVIPEYKNFCSSSPCSNGGTCYNEAAGYFCSCTEEWIGRDCAQSATRPSKPQLLEYNRTFYQEYESSVLLSCPVTGYPQPQIMWYKDEVLLEGIRTEEYEIKRLNLDTRGIYHCNATNELGSIKSDNIYVKIKGLVQYQANISFTEDYINSKIIKDNKRQDDEPLHTHLNKLINIIKGELRDILSLNASADVRFLSLAVHDNVMSLLQPIPFILTLWSKSGGSDMLKAFVEDAFNKLKLKLAASSNISSPWDIIDIKRFDGCTPETTEIPSPNGDPNLNFAFAWPETDLSQPVTLRCPCGPEGFDIGIVRNATRWCLGNFEAGAEWDVPIDAACNFSTSARELCALASLSEANKVLTGLDNITAVTEDIGSLELSISTVFVENLTTIVKGDREFTKTYLSVTDNLLSVNQEAIIESNEEARTSGRLLQSFEGVIEDIPVTFNATEILMHNKFVVAVQELDTTGLDGNGSIVFSVNGSTDDFNSVNSVSLSNDFMDPNATIVIPSTILRNLSSSSIRLIHTAFNTDALFLRRNSSFSRWSHLRVSSILVSASIAQHNISHEEYLINITLKKDKVQSINTICSFWDHVSDDYYGDWSSYGCEVLNEDTDSVTCGCNHLTTFALLLDVSPTQEPVEPPGYEEFLISLTYLGCAVSTLCLTLIILTYCTEKHLRSTNNGKLLINMSCALIGLYITFIPALYAYTIEQLCIALGALVQYFFLAVLLSMASEATILYVELVKVFSSGKSRMLIKAALVTWVTPLLIVGFSLAPNPKNYANKELSQCRPNEWQYWIGYIGPFSVIYIYNWIVFFIIIVSLSKQQLRMSSQTGNSNLQSTAKQLVLMTTLSILFGLGWGVGLAATTSFPVQWLRYSFQIAFIIIIGFQGLFIFILYGLKVTKVRKTWLKWFYKVTNQHTKAQKVEYSMKSTYHFKSSSQRTKTMSYTLGTFDDCNNVELKKADKFISLSLSPSPEPITDVTVKKLRILEAGNVRTLNVSGSDVDSKD